uniref:Zinc finger, CCHC-type n=1 Tax=Tanacetum cinerariifolium TaxID=118510 RepID=A0A6L2NST0_TANCI|nr:zinc finger, CCHC-type [Tanacetum cinerariifolium]
MEIVRDQSDNALRVSQSRFYNEKLVQTLLKGYSILSLEGSLSGDYDVEKIGKWSCIYAVGSREYQMTYRFLWILTTPWEDQSLSWLDKSQESRYELRLVAGIATGALVKGGSRSKVPAQVEVYRGARKLTVDSSFKKLSVEKLSISDIQRLEWEALNAKIDKWIRAAIRSHIDVVFDRELGEAIRV